MRRIQLDPDALRAMYCGEKRSVHDIAKRLDVSAYVVCDRLREFGIEIRQRKVQIAKEELQKYMDEDMPVTTIAKKRDVSINTVYKLLKEYGIPVKGRRIDLPAPMLVKKYVREKKSAREIAAELGCGEAAILNNLHRANIPVRNSNNKQRLNIPKEDLERMYVTGGLTCPDIASKLNCDQATINRKLREYGIPRRTSGTRSTTIIPESLLRRMHLDENMTCAEIAKKLNVSDVTVTERLRKYGIPVRGRKLTKVLTRDVIKRMYVEEGLSATEIAKHFNCHPETVQSYRKKFGIPPRRDYSDPIYAERRRLRPYGKTMFGKMREILGAACAVCSRNDVPLSIHHMCYLPYDVIRENYGGRDYLYHIDLEPLVRKDPERFRLLCANCHRLVGLFQKYEDATREKMFKTVKDMVSMRQTNPTRHDDLVRSK